MHNSIRAFVEEHAEKLQGDVIEVGSLDVNGNVRDIVPHAIGTDMRAGPNVDVVCPAERLIEHFGPERFDAVMSFDAFEHVKDWRACVRNMWGVLKPDGWLVMTMASHQKGRHAYPDDYWRADWRMVAEIFPDATDMETISVSMGWTVQKKRELPSLDEITLIPVP